MTKAAKYDLAAFLRVGGRIDPPATLREALRAGDEFE
jgi:hypothetical protein